MTGDFPYRLSGHARRRLHQRGIRLAWVQRTMEKPDRRAADDEDEDLTVVTKRIHEADDRVLRVVYNHVCVPWRVVTAFFVRSGRRRS